MSFPDPEIITISAVPITCPRVSVGDDESEYQSGDGLTQLVVSHNYGKRYRRMIRLNTQKLTADPFKPTENVKVTQSIYCVFDGPQAGYTAAEQLAAWIGFRTLLAASSDSLITKLLGGES